MSAQLKTVIDRFCAYNSSLNSRHLRSALLTAAWNSDDWTFDALEAHYKTLVRYINFKDRGMVLGYGCGTPGTSDIYAADGSLPGVHEGFFQLLQKAFRNRCKGLIAIPCNIE